MLFKKQFQCLVNIWRNLPLFHLLGGIFPQRDLRRLFLGNLAGLLNRHGWECAQAQPTLCGCPPLSSPVHQIERFFPRYPNANSKARHVTIKGGISFASNFQTFDHALCELHRQNLLLAIGLPPGYHEGDKIRTFKVTRCNYKCPYFQRQEIWWNLVKIQPDDS